MRALGIDVGVGKGLDLVLLDDQRVPVLVLPSVGVEQVPRAIEEMAPDVIAIDAPPTWAADGRSRLTERVLAERNIRTFATPTRARGKGNPFYDWMEVGFRVFRAAARAGFPRYAAGDPRGTAMEVFPHASATVLRGFLRPKGIAKKAWREGILVAQGVRTDRLTSIDLIDAGLCALTGLLALQGKRFAPGDPREGVIVLPAVTLPAAPFAPFRQDSSTTTAARASPEAAAWLSLVAYVRHVLTEYDELLDQGYDVDSARHFVAADIDATLKRWGVRRRLSADD